MKRYLCRMGGRGGGGVYSPAGGITPWNMSPSLVAGRTLICSTLSPSSLSAHTHATSEGSHQYLSGKILVNKSCVWQRRLWKHRHTKTPKTMVSTGKGMKCEKRGEGEEFCFYILKLESVLVWRFFSLSPFRSVLGETWAYRSFVSGLLVMGLLHENRYKDRGEVTWLVLWAFPTCQQAAPTSAGAVWGHWTAEASGTPEPPKCLWQGPGDAGREHLGEPLPMGTFMVQKRREREKKTN